jgi:hypothetical protein
LERCRKTPSRKHSFPLSKPILVDPETAPFPTPPA